MRFGIMDMRFCCAQESHMSASDSNTYKLSNKVKNKTLVSLSVYNVGREKCEPGKQWGPGVRDHYLITYVLAGKGTYTVYRPIPQAYHLKAGDVFLIQPDTEVSYRADREDPWEYQWVGFAGSDAAAMIGSTNFAPGNLVLHTGEHPTHGHSGKSRELGPELSRRLSLINEAFGPSFRDSVEMTGQLYLALSLFMHRTAAEGIPVNTERANVRKACSYIDSHYSFAISIDDVADYVGISRSTLYRQFLHCHGQSPKQYLDEFRIHRACLLLTETDLSVGSISTSLGYTSQLYFSKAFRRLTGVSPSEYRRREQKSRLQSL